jgi:sulfate transporter 4
MQYVLLACTISAVTNKCCCCWLAGCKTGLSGFVTACVVGLVLLVLTPVFEKLPLNVMGAIVVSGVSGLFEYEQAVHLFKVGVCLDLWIVFLGTE